MAPCQMNCGPLAIHHTPLQKCSNFWIFASITSEVQAFRDYLIAHPHVAAEYAALKSRLAETCDNDNDKYCDGKEAFVQSHEKKALEWQA